MAFSAMPFWKWALTPQKVRVLEGIVCKLSIVTVVVEVTEDVLLDKVFEGSFGFNRLF